MSFRCISLITAFLWLTSGLGVGFAADGSTTTDLTKVPSGKYLVDPSHTSVTFYVSHLGLSPFASRFDKIGGEMTFDSEQPEKSKLQITLDPASINTNSAELDEKLRADDGLNPKKYPTMTFVSTKIERTGPTTGLITGDFTMMGVTKPVTLDVVFVGAGIHPFSKKQAMGFSATGKLLRSDFGFTKWAPLVGDEIKMQISAEFNQ